MAKGSEKTIFICSECGAVFDKWNGRCRECGSWNSLVEEKKVPKEALASTSPLLIPPARPAMPLVDMDEHTDGDIRWYTGMPELDRALGGGLVKGSVSLISGEPGIGKSTLLLQVCNRKDALKILYISGEESPHQINLRARRLGVKNPHLYFLAETEVEKIIHECERIKPDLMIVDSIQTAGSSGTSASPGSVSQVKQSALHFIAYTKMAGCATVLVGHVNKDGAIAGPKVLEHMVDVVLYFEGERNQSLRVVRAVKNRFGSTGEIGVFEMTDTGLSELSEPGKMLLEGRPVGVSGNAVVCTIEGTRPLLAEVQALTSKTVFPAPRRTVTGIDYNRASILLAVLERRLGIRFGERDVYINVIGGLRLEDVSSDLGVQAALLSAYSDISFPDDAVCFGEVGLAGECRAASHGLNRVKEAAKLGFKRMLLPAKSMEIISKQSPSGIELVPIRSVYDLSAFLRRTKEDAHV